MKRLLLLSVAAVPLAHALPAVAQTTISDARTAPVATATAANGAASDVTVAAGGSIRLGAPGTALTLNSNNAVINRGTIEFVGRNDSTGIAIEGGRTGSVENTGTISLIEDYTPTDTDNDGDIDGLFAQGTNRFGIRLGGTGAFTGNVSHLRGGAINIEGNNSGGIVLDQALVGALRSAGAISVVGDNSVGLSATSVSGDVNVLGAVTTVGQNSTAVRLGEVGGRLVLQNAITATGYRTTTRAADKAVRDKLDADDLKQGGAAVRLTGSIAGGVLLDRQPADASTTDTDEDDDGIPDAEESTAAISVAGSAPALDIGGASALRIGVLGTGDNAYGLINRGGVAVSGVYDGVNATAIRVGGANGAAAVIDGGIRLSAGGVRADGFEADATGLLFNAGAATPELRNDRGSSLVGAIVAETAKTSSAIVIDAGASLPLIRNAGELAATVSGEKASAATIVDRSGTLARIENTGVIRAVITPTDDAKDADDSDTNAGNEVVTGQAIALDLRANTSGVTLIQTGVTDGDDGGDNVADPDTDGDGVDNADEPAIAGDVLLGSGADRVELRNGTFLGRLAFGAGADTLLVDGGADVRAALSDSDGALAVDLRKGRLELTTGDTVNVSSLSVASDGVLGFTLDPAKANGDLFKVSGAANLATGAKIDVNLASLLTAPASYRIIDAGSLQTGALDGALTGAPYLYIASLRSAAAEGDLFVDLRRRTTAELGFNRSEAAAYDAVFASLGQDDRIERAFLAKNDRESLTSLYDQLLPDHSGGSLMSAAAISSAISGAINAHSGATGTPSANGAWVQQVFFNIEQDREQALGYEAQGLGVAGGLEAVSTGDSAFGVSAALVAAEYNDADASLGDEIAMTFGEIGAYLRWVRGPLRADARLGGGYVAFDGERRVVSVDDSLNLTTQAEWNGWLVDAHAGAAYEQPLGRFYARPSVVVDYIYLNESDYEESGGGVGVDLDVDSRSGNLLTGNVKLALGATFGDTGFRWGPEVAVGWRQRLAGDIGETVARFRSGGSAFELEGEDPIDGGPLVRAALRGALGRTTFALEGGVEQDGDYSAYDVRAVIRFSL